MDKKYPVLYPLHGIGGDESEWRCFAEPNVLGERIMKRSIITMAGLLSLALFS